MTWQLYPASSLERFAPEWERLNSACHDVPFLQAAFLVHALRYFGKGHELLAIYTLQDAPVAMAVVERKRWGVWETFQPSQLPLGAWVMAPEFEFTPMLRELMRSLPGLPVLIGVTQQDPYLITRPEDRTHIQTVDYIQTAWVEVSGEFDEYWKERGKNLRQNMKRQRAKLESDGVRAQLEVIKSPDDVASAIKDYGRLESEGWKTGTGTAIHSGNAQGQFYRAMLEDFCRRDAGRIYRYRLNEKVVAVDLCIEGSGIQVVLKTTYDESYKNLSLSSLMRQEAFREIFDEGRVKRIEFYGRRMEWHSRWTDHERTLFHVNYYRWPIMPKLHRLRSQRQPAAAAAASISGS